MEDLNLTSHTKTRQVIRARVLAETRRDYGSLVDDDTLQVWVQASLDSLLTERTRVTTFVPLLAMRDIREFAAQF